MIIAQISDTHIAVDSEDAAQRIQDFKDVLADIAALDTLPDIVVHSGDIVHNGLEEEYQQVHQILEDFEFPVHLMVGNKDNREVLRKCFADQAYLSNGSEFIAYSVETETMLFVMLDTLCTTSNKGKFCEKRASQFDELIKQSPDKPTAVFAHHPAFTVSVGPDPMHFETKTDMERFSKTINASNRVIGAFCGHVHRSTTGFIGKVPATVMSAVATPLRRGEYPTHMTGRPTYALHRYDPEYGFCTETRIVGL